MRALALAFIKKIIIFLLVLLLFTDIFGQQFNFCRYTKEDGLLQAHIETIIEDSRGYIWIGTESSGINVFDSRRFTAYTTGEGLPDNKIRCIFEDSKGRIWIGMKSGYLCSFNGTEFTRFNHNNGLDDNHISAITEDKNGVIWAGTHNGGLYTLHGDNFRKIRMIADTTDISIKTLFVDRQGDLWVGTKRRGIYIIHGGGFKNLTVKDGLSNNNINKIIQDREGYIWIATRYGVSKFNGWNFKNYYDSDGLPSSYITALACDREGSIWFGSYGYGASRLSGDEFTCFKTGNGLCNDFVMGIIPDRSGNIWFATDGGGVCRLDGEYLVHFTVNDGLPGNNVLSVCQDNKGKVWFATDGSGVGYIDGKELKVLRKCDGICSNFIQRIYEDSKGNLWFASRENGVTRYNEGAITNFSVYNGLACNMVQTIFEDSKGNIWLGTYGGGISLYDGSRFTNLSKDNGFISNLIRTIIEDNEGNIWIGTEDEGMIMIFRELGSMGIIRDKKIDEFGFVNIKSNYGLGSNNVVDLLQDKNGFLWIGTVGGGVGRFDGKRIVNYSTKDGLTSDNVNFLLFDSDRNLWIGTDKGLNVIRYSVRSNQVGIEEYLGDAGFNHLGAMVFDGMRDKAGNLWFASSDGLSRYSPHLDKPGFLSTVVHINDVSLFSESTDWTQFCDSVTGWGALPVGLKLPHSKNHLKFDFAGIDMRAPGKVCYQWILEGFDKEWSPLSREDNVTYSFIPFGDYTFMVRTIDRYGNISDSPATFAFSISPPFWADWKFYVIAGLITLIIFILYFRIRHNQLIREKQILEEKVTERTKMLEEEKQTVENQKDMLKEQTTRLEQINNELVKLSIVASKTSNAVVIFDSDTNIEWANTGFTTMYDYTTDEFQHQYGRSIYETSNNPNIREAIRRCIETKNAIDYVTLVTTKKGVKKWIQTTLTPALDEYDNIEKFIAVESDITKIKEAEEEIQRQKEEIETEKEKSDTLLLNILPDETARELKSKGFAVPRFYRLVSVMFSDIKGFTSSCEHLTPKQLVFELHTYFALFDEIVEQHFVEKIKTIGDAYMCVGGVPIRNRTHSFNTVLAGLEIQRKVRLLNIAKQKKGTPVWELRLGIHSGEVVAGVVGKKKFAYDIWGDTVNIAARMEEAGEVNRVNISGTTYELIRDFFVCEHRGKIDVKNKGKTDMYFVDGIKPEYSVDGEGIVPNTVFKRYLARL
ncbi:MAG: PAS domain-containing protein [Bacteroidetes bacterium]|nr:PAS domain-containing protein [Bacteroidota bacterium]